MSTKDKGSKPVPADSDPESFFGESGVQTTLVGAEGEIEALRAASAAPVEAGSLPFASGDFDDPSVKTAVTEVPDLSLARPPAPATPPAGPSSGAKKPILDDITTLESADPAKPPTTPLSDLPVPANTDEIDDPFAVVTAPTPAGVTPGLDPAKKPAFAPTGKAAPAARSAVAPASAPAAKAAVAPAPAPTGKPAAAKPTSASRPTAASPPKSTPAAAPVSAFAPPTQPGAEPAAAVVTQPAPASALAAATQSPPISAFAQPTQPAPASAFAQPTQRAPASASTPAAKPVPASTWETESASLSGQSAPTSAFAPVTKPAPASALHPPTKPAAVASESSSLSGSFSTDDDEPAARGKRGKVIVAAIVTALSLAAIIAVVVMLVRGEGSPPTSDQPFQPAAADAGGTPAPPKETATAPAADDGEAKSDAGETAAAAAEPPSPIDAPAEEPAGRADLPTAATAEAKEKTTAEAQPTPFDEPAAKAFDLRYPARFPFQYIRALEPTAGRLTELVTEARRCTGQIVLVGHADSIGPADFNRELGLKRAQHVKKVLVSAGVGRGRIDVESRGSSQPIASNADEAGRERNRRVMVECRTP